MKRLLLLAVSSILAFNVSAQIHSLTIDSVQWRSATDLANCNEKTRYDGDTVKVAGICLVDGAAYGSSSHNIQISMSTAGSPFGAIRLRQGDPNAQYNVSIRNLKQGDSILVVGTMSEYRGETQLEPLETNDAIKVLKRRLTVKDQVLPIGTFNDNQANNILSTGEQWESAFVTFKDVEVVAVSPFSGNRVSFTIQDKAGNRINVGDHFTAQKTAAYTHPVTNQPGAFSPPSVGDKFNSISGIIIHSLNDCPGENGRGYEIHPFDASHYKYGPSAPRITNVKRQHSVPTSSQTVDITATITDLDGSITAATVYYNTGTDPSNTNFNALPMTVVSGSNYSATIPAHNDGVFVKYYIKAEDDSANVTQLPNSNPTSGTYSYRVRDNGLSIYDVQFTPFEDGNSPFMNQEVTVTGVVTSSGSKCDLSLIHIQDETILGGWSGIELQNAGQTFTPGDKIEVTGNVIENRGKTTISVSSIKTAGTGTVEPLYIAPDTFTTYNFASNEKYESVLIGLINTAGKVHVVDTNADNGNNYAEWRVGTDKFDPATGCRVLTGRENFSSTYVSYVNLSGNIKDPYPVQKVIVTDTITIDTLVGVMSYSFGNMKLLPRNNKDFRGVNAISADTTCGKIETSIAAVQSENATVNVYPNPANGTVKVSNQDNKNLVVMVMDLNGKTVIQHTSSASLTTINTATLENGVYVIVAETLDHQEVLLREKLIIQH